MNFTVLSARSQKYSVVLRTFQHSLLVYHIRRFLLKLILSSFSILGTTVAESILKFTSLNKKHDGICSTKTLSYTAGGRISIIIKTSYNCHLSFKKRSMDHAGIFIESLLQHSGIWTGFRKRTASFEFMRLFASRLFVSAISHLEIVVVGRNSNPPDLS